MIKKERRKRSRSPFPYSVIRPFFLSFSPQFLILPFPFLLTLSPFPPAPAPTTTTTPPRLSLHFSAL